MNNDEVPELDDNPIMGGHAILSWDDIPLDGSRFYIVERDQIFGQGADADGTIRGYDSLGYVTAHTEDSITVEYDWSRRYYKHPDGNEIYFDWEYNAEGDQGANGLELMDLPTMTITKEEIDNVGSGPNHFLALFEHEQLPLPQAANAAAANNNMNMPLMQGLIASAPDPNILIRRSNGPGLTVSVARSRRRRRQKKRRQGKTRRKYGI
jgi:hypothetical protein